MDGLQALSQNQSYSSEEIDINYRTALELTRAGELQITIPKLTSPFANSTTFPPRPVPKRCAKEVYERYKNLISMYRNLTDIRDYGNDNDNDNDGENNKPCYLLQVRIVYKLDKPSTGKFPSGYAVQTTPQFASLFMKTIPLPDGEGLSKPTFCVYSTVSQSDRFCSRDVDGVRCWLPCLDALDQRMIFDISFKTPRKYSVMCSGERISTIKVPRQRETADGIALKVTRFFTPYRIATSSLGFFIGPVESYNMPLYKVKSKFWVATGLNDFSLGTLKTNKQTVDHVASKPKVSSRKRALSFRSNNDKAAESIVSRTAEVHTVTDHEKDPESADDIHLGASPLQMKRSKETSAEMSDEPIVKRKRLNSLDLFTEYDVDALLNVSSTYVALDQKTTEENLSPKAHHLISLHDPSRLQTDNHGDLDDGPIAEDEAELVNDSVRAQNKLYARAVHHSSLGLDMALRHLHKFAGRKFPYSQFCFVYVHNLGHDFMSFDGFTLVDAKFLTGAEQIYQESSAHMTLLTAYLYSWMKTSLPLHSHECKFIMHGTIGYLLNIYVAEVFGEDDGKYRCQKQYDTVIELEKQGMTVPLATFFPEYYETFTLMYGQYLNCKATVIFHLIESNIGGRESMRAAIKNIIRSPSLFSQAHHGRHSMGGGLYGSNSPISGAYLKGFLSQDGNSSSHSGDTSPNIQAMFPGSSLGLGSTTPYGGQLSPYYHAGNMSVVAPNIDGTAPYSPYYGGNMSPYVSAHYTGGDMSPYNQSQKPLAYYSPSHAFSSQSPAVAYGGVLGGYGFNYSSGGNSVQLSPATSLYRQPSISSETGWGRDFSALSSDNLSAEKLIFDCRLASGVSSDIDETFLEKFVYSSRGSSIIMRVNLTISQKIENKPRQIFIVAERMGFVMNCDYLRLSDRDLLLGGQSIGASELGKDDVKVRLAEVRDDVVTEPILSLSVNRKETYQQQAFSRPGRRSGRRRGSTKKSGEEELSAEMVEEMARKEREKEERKPVLQLVRDLLDHPIRYAVVDPQCLTISEVHNTSSDSLLIEQLFADLGEKSICSQCQVLRSIGRTVVNSAIIATPGVAPINADASSSSSSVTKGAPLRSDRSSKLHLKTLTCCLMGTSPFSQSSSDINCISGPHSVYVRAEAAFALAKWQNYNAPKYASSSASVTTAEISITGSASWHAMNALIDCLQDLYMIVDPETDSHMPLPNDFANESWTHLRSAIILALSTIKSQSGHTPIRVVELLLTFFNFSSDEPMAYSTQSNVAVVSNYYDDIHYRATLLLAFSRVRFENISSISYNRTGNVSLNTSTSQSLVSEVISLCLSTINAAITSARSTARIHYMSLFTAGDAFSRSHPLPVLQGNGLDVAAAITCLAEIDIQATAISSAPNSLGQSSNRGKESLMALQERDRITIGSSVTPTGTGLASGFNYIKCILHPSCSLRCVHMQGSTTSEKDVKPEGFYFLCCPLVRVAAFEAFVRLSFAQHLSHENRFIALHGGGKKGTTATAVETTPAKLAESTFIASIFEVLVAVLKTDPM